jgi:cell cycle checkpoint protein MEC1
MAAYSCLGYIIGLGDRHLQNVLIKKEEGKIVHIDFDCLFSWGYHMKVKELVQFRLTNNFQQALGVTGPYGLFYEYFKEFALFFQKNIKDVVDFMDSF